MHWRRYWRNGSSERRYSVHIDRKYSDEEFDDSYNSDAPFSLRTFGICSRKSDNSILNRYIDRYIFHYVLTGKGWFNGSRFKAGDIIFCTDSSPYSLSSDPNNPCTYAWISFNGGKSEKYVTAMGLLQTYRIYPAKHFQEICAILYDMIDTDHPNVDIALYLESCLIRLLAFSVPEQEQAPTEAAQKPLSKVNSAIQFISDHYKDPMLSQKDIADAAQANEKYLQRLFKAETGQTLHQYLENIRMEAAVAMLNSSNYNINEISEYIGYNDRRTFSEAFKRKFGDSPSRYREAEH
ncbi:MAG TPA: hypothetical protein DDW30_05890 [Clostridiales bacterium]|nr:hypothetical protein [Clostridiales bacterium]